MISISACSTPDGTIEELPSAEQEITTADASEVTGFRFEVSPPDTVVLTWSGEGSAVVIGIHISAGEGIQEGDTLFRLLEDLHVVEMERLSMELDMASAMLPSDSLLQPKVDSLKSLLDSLPSNENTQYLSPLQGIAVEILIETDQRIRPGNAVLELSVTSNELFLVFPPDDCTVNFWPAGGSLFHLVEERDAYAVYSGELPAIEARFSEILAVPRFALYENELDSYVITVEHDTVSVSRMGEKENNLVIILPAESLTSDLLTWADK
jgi:biotin carboxyl carrier protein